MYPHLGIKPKIQAALAIKERNVAARHRFELHVAQRQLVCDLARGQGGRVAVWSQRQGVLGVPGCPGGGNSPVGLLGHVCIPSAAMSAHISNRASHLQQHVSHGRRIMRTPRSMPTAHTPHLLCDRNIMYMDIQQHCRLHSRVRGVLCHPC